MSEQRKSKPRRKPKKFSNGAKTTVAALSILSFIGGWNLIARHDRQTAQANTPPDSPAPSQPVNLVMPAPTPWPTIPPIPTLPPMPTLVPSPVVSGAIDVAGGNAGAVQAPASQTGASPVQVSPIPTVAPLPTLAPLPPMPAMPELPPPPPMPTWNGGGGGGNHSGGS